MPAAVKLRTYSVDELRRLAKGSKDANQSRRLLSLAAVLDGMNRADGACNEFRVWLGQYGKEGDVPWPDARNLGSPTLSSTSC